MVVPCLSSDSHKAYYGYTDIRLSFGYHGKTIDFEKYSPCHRTMVAHFLNKAKWDEARLEDILKSTVVQLIYKEARRFGKPVFCIVDDTISSKTKPPSRALHPIEDAYFHQSHLKGKQNYGHQVVAIMLSCNGIILNYAIVMYGKTMPKVKSVQEIADKLPASLVISYFLCDSWYTCGDLNGIENAVVLISYPKDVFPVPRALRTFISTYVSLSTREILDTYVEHWLVENQSKNKLAFDRYQSRSSEGIRRYWMLISLVHLIACTGCGKTMSFEGGYAYIYSYI